MLAKHTRLDLDRRLSRTDMSRSFGRYKKEVTQPVRQVEVKEDRKLAKIRAAWDNLRLVTQDSPDYEEACRLVRDIGHSAKNVERFSISLADLQDEQFFGIRAGYFLSALVATGKSRTYRITTRHLAYQIHELGYFNPKNKNIIVDGDIGYGVGVKMIGGIILVRGNTASAVGQEMEGGNIIVEGSVVDGIAGFEMRGGKILIKGNGGDRIGYYMRGGTLEVMGTAGEFVGEDAKGGTIYLNCDYKSIDETTRARIYHRGALVNQPK